jgi:hypothetical protein
MIMRRGKEQRHAVIERGVRDKEWTMEYSRRKYCMGLWGQFVGTKQSTEKVTSPTRRGEMIGRAINSRFS